MRLPWRRPRSVPSQPVRTADPSTLLEALDHHVATRGGEVFTRHLSAGGVYELTFAQFSARAARFAARLSAAGAGKGDVVLIFLPTSPEALPAFVGAMMIGAVPSLMPCPSAKQHPSVYWPSHRRLLDRIRPRVLLTDRDQAARMAENGLAADGRIILAIEDLGGDATPAPRVRVDPGDIALLQHSSGTTALKKGVSLSHAAILKQARAYADRLGATADDGIVTWLPIYHDMGLIACSIVPLVLGQTVTILDPFEWVARPVTLFDAIRRYDGRFVWLPNFAFEHLTRAVPADYAGDLSQVRALIDCSEPCKPDTFDRFAARFAGIGVRREMLQVCYAMAETVFAVTQTTPGRIVGRIAIDRDAIQRERRAVDLRDGAATVELLSNGAPIDGITVTIRDGDTMLGENRVGEIVVSGDFLFDGYFNDPATTADRLSGGCYRTRDLGFVRDNELYVLGRTDDMLIISGRNLHAHEVEEIVGAIPGLKPGRATAFGVYNDTNASEELVIVAERDGDAAAPTRDFGRLVREAVFDRAGIDVKDVSVVDPGWLVKTTSGKISRERNKARYLETAVSASLARKPTKMTGDGSFEDVAKVISRTFRCPIKKVTRDTVAADISGWDSLAHSTLILEIEQALGIRFSDDEIFGFENVGALADRTIALVVEGGGPADRIIAENDNFSIVVLGEPSDAPDLIIFAGAALEFAGHNLLDFASTLRGTPAERSRRFFVTDRSKHWFTDSLDEIAVALNAASPGPKMLLGNSMGGYGALKFAPLLDNVLSVLSFAPQPAPPRKIARELNREGAEWYVTPTAGIPTCIIYGEIEDERGKAWVQKTFTDPQLHTLLTLPNCGHKVVPYLNGRGLLPKALNTALDPATMGAALEEIVASVDHSEAELRKYVQNLSFEKMGRALGYLNKRYPKATQVNSDPVG